MKTVKPLWLSSLCFRAVHRLDRLGLFDEAPVLTRAARRLGCKGVALLLGVLILVHAARAGVNGQARVKAPRFSHPRGFCDSTFVLTIRSETPGAGIRYTLNGGAPAPSDGADSPTTLTINRPAIVRAIAYRKGMTPSRVVTQSYIFLDDNDGHWGILHQPNNPTYADGTPFPPTWTDRVGNNGSVPADYAMNSTENDARTRNALLAIPSLSMVLDHDDLFHRILNSGGKERNKGLERPASMEMIYPDAPGRDFQIDCGFRPRSRALHRNPKRGFLLIFRTEFGPSRLEEPVFASAPRNGDTAADSYKRLILRQGFVDCWPAQNYNDDEDTFTRDPVVREAELDVQDGKGTHNAWVHLYLNGLYFGLYNLTEKIDEHHAADYFGGDAEDWLVVKSRLDSTDDGIVKHGDDTRYRAMLKRIGEQGRNSLADDAAYRRVCEDLDPEHLAEYIMTHSFHGTGDWPDNNWFFLMRNHPPRPGFFQIWDAEKSLARLYTADAQPGDGRDQAWYSTVVQEGRAVPARAWMAMITNEDFRLTFADVVHRNLFNGGPLTDVNARQRWLDLAGHLGRNHRDHAAVIGEAARWGDHVYVDADVRPADFDDWKTAVDRVTAKLSDNVAVFMREFDALLPDTAAPTIRRNGKNVTAQKLDSAVGDSISVSAEEGTTIYHTLDGTDPRQFGEPNRGAPIGNRYAGAFPIHHTTTVKARARRNGDGEWSALTAITFFVPQDFSALKITEIMYHPLDREKDTDEYCEFLELKNTGRTTLHLDGVAISGLKYTFPAGAQIAPAHFLVLSRYRGGFESRYPEVPLFDEFDGGLDNGGEKIKLEAPDGKVFFSVDYDDKSPWPASADGLGHSLVPRNPNAAGNPDDPAYWRASARIHGSPGADDPEPPSGGKPGR